MIDTDFYSRIAHRIWELRDSPDGSDKVIVRKEDEPLTRTASQKINPIKFMTKEDVERERQRYSEPADAEDKAKQRRKMRNLDPADELPDWMEPGAKVGCMSPTTGELAEAMIVFKDPTLQLVDLVLDSGEEMMGVEPSQLMVIEPEPEPEMFEPRQAANFETDFTPGSVMVVNSTFRPVMMDNRVILYRGDKLIMEGASKPQAGESQMYAIPKPVQPANPNQNVINYMRVRARKYEGGPLMYLTGSEYNQYLTQASTSFEAPELPQTMPGESVFDPATEPTLVNHRVPLPR